jgi:hypothetical protein
MFILFVVAILLFFLCRLDFALQISQVVPFSTALRLKHIMHIPSSRACCLFLFRNVLRTSLMCFFFSSEHSAFRVASFSRQSAHWESPGTAFA